MDENNSTNDSLKNADDPAKNTPVSAPPPLADSTPSSGTSDPVSESTPPENTMHSPVAEPPANHSKLMISIGIAIALVIVGGAAFFLMHHKAQPKKSAQGINLADLQIQEAPELAQQVAAKTLPSVHERIPKIPVILNTEERIGQYGGIWHMAALNNNDHAILYRTVGYENLVRWDPTWTSVIPNVAQSVNANSKGTEYTFTLRQGMKWSDGQPFTADDIMFWYNDILTNKDLTPSPNNAWKVNGQLVTVKKIDDYSVKFVFPAPNGLFLKTLAQVVGGEPTSYPAHYLKQFHNKYSPQQVQSMMAAGGFKSFKDFFESKFGTIGTSDNANRWAHPELPTLDAWMLTTPYGAGVGKDVIAVRNPYYWKIDTAGHQLPYINQIDVQIVPGKSNILALAAAGKIDMQDRNIGNGGLNSAQNKPTLEKSQQAGSYHLFPTILSFMNNVVISPNLTDKNPTLRAFFDSKDARTGMSYAINRPLIIKDVYAGQGTPFQVSPRPETPYYNKTLATQYTDYDVTKANQELDKAGYSQRDAQGYRLSPDGHRISFTVDWGNTDVLKELQIDWKAVGLEMAIGNTADRTAYYNKKGTNGLDVGTWDGDGGLDPLLDPRAYFPFSNESNYAIPWAYWYSDKTNPLAQEPPDYVKKQQSLYNQIIATTDEKKQDNYMKQILQISADQFYDMGINLPSNGFGIVKNNFHNVPKSMPYAFTYPAPAPTNTAQYFISDN